MGTARGDHKECGVQVGTLNLDCDVRFAEKNILLPALAKAKVYKVHGMARIMNGVDQDGVQHDEPNYAKDMRELDKGRWILIPDDDNGGALKWIRLCVWEIMFSGDYLGAQSMLPFVESPSAYVMCRGCDYDVRSGMAGRPFSFLRGPSSKGHSVVFKERDWPTLKPVLDRLRAGVGSTEQKKLYQAHGLNKLEFALDPDYHPHINPATVAPQDALHLFPDGLLRSELAWLMYIFHKHGLTFEQVNVATRRYKGLPKDVRIPASPEKLGKGNAGGIPKSSSVVRMTGSQCMHFSLHR